MTDHVRVCSAYRAMYVDPITLVRGESLIAGHEDSEFPGWYWCTNGNGKSGWVHQRFLESVGGPTRATTDYTAVELSVAAGDEGTVLERLDGWVYLQLADGRVGWVPEASVKSAV